MNTGIALSAVIKQELKGMTLSIQQQAKLQSVLKGIGGDFIPDDFELAIFDVKLMVLDEKIDDLLTLLKQLPLAGKTLQKLHYLIDGKRCNRAEFFSGDTIKGQRSIRNSQVNNIKFTDMTEEEYRLTEFSKTRLGEVRGLQLFGDGYCVPHKEYKKSIDTAYPTAQPQPVCVPTPYGDIGDDDEDSLSAEQEFEFNEPSMPEIRRNRYGSD